jgi:hypothetical protein
MLFNQRARSYAVPNPANFPIQRRTKCDLVVNLKVAKALGFDRLSRNPGARERGDRISVDVCSWHFSDMPRRWDDVCFMGVEQTLFKRPPVSLFDPEQTLT